MIRRYSPGSRTRSFRPRIVTACPDCNTPLRQVDDRTGREAFMCPIAMEAQRRGILGQPGRKHTAVYVFTPAK